MTLDGFSEIGRWQYQDKGQNVGSLEPVLSIEPERPFPYRLYVGELRSNAHGNSPKARLMKKVWNVSPRNVQNTVSRGK